VDVDDVGLRRGLFVGGGGDFVAHGGGIYDLRFMTYDLEIAVSAVVACCFDKRMGTEE
jgi:hypothetical protein